MPGKKRPEEERREEILEGAFRVAARDQLGGLSVRAVAEEAGVSKGLVFFHFTDKETLLRALLDWVLERGPRVEVPARLEAGGEDLHPAARLVALVEHQVSLLPERRARVQLFLDFWLMGMSRPELRDRIRAGFEAYRSQFLPFAEAAVEAMPDRFGAGDAEGLASAAVSYIQGCALQLNADPESFDVERYVRVLRGLVAVG